MTTVALALALADEERLAAQAPRYGHRVVARCSGAEELCAQLAIVTPELAVVAAAPQYLTARVVSSCDALGVRLLAVATSPAERRYAASLGLVDVLDAPFEWTSGQPAEIPAMTTVPASSPTAPSRGTVIAVWGPEGAPGRTSVAIALAAELAERGVSVALADADTHAASIAPALGLLDEAPGFAAACRLAGTGGLDRAQFERIGRSRRSGHAEFWVLTGLGRASRWPELTAERIAGVLSAVRDWVEVTVVDVAASFERDEELMTDLGAPRRNAATIEVLRSADRVVAVGSADPVGLSRFLRAHADLVELTAPDRIATVINKVRSSAIGLNPGAQVQQTLARFGGIDDPVLVPWDLAAFDAALLSGRTLGDVAPRSAARVAIRELAARVSPPAAATTGARSWPPAWLSGARRRGRRGGAAHPPDAARAPSAPYSAPAKRLPGTA
ncbi:CpaE family protein [Lysinimonas soli]|uniref:CpaE family protein n=1 Tax=Lysinimonas soli TaxID=1074233 RepID=A0ABW0NVN3_9MICO